jgi:hypothetical protein
VQNLDLAGMFMLGLLGSGHCIGMCGPLVFALPGKSGRFMSHVWYHLGRVVTYAALGGVLGGAGGFLAQLSGVETRTGLPGILAALRLLAAAFLFAFGLNRLGWLPEPRWLSQVNPAKIPGFGRVLGRASGDRNGQAAFFGLGVLLGFLPCGLSYGAFAQALGAGSAATGLLLALAFALGTAPGLLMLGTGVAAFVQRYRRASDLVAGGLMLFMALRLAGGALRALV